MSGPATAAAPEKLPLDILLTDLTFLFVAIMERFRQGRFKLGSIHNLCLLPEFHQPASVRSCAPASEALCGGDSL